MSATVPISAIITAHRRVAATIATLKRITDCMPSPDEVLVHVDAGVLACANAVREVFPDARVILSEENCGPGGGRNKLVAAAKNDTIASFDDDSYPYDSDYFARAWELSRQLPDAAVIAARIVHPGETVPPDMKAVSQMSSFGAGGAILNKPAFLAAGGFVPVPIAYGMEEEDLSLRLCELPLEQLGSPWLRVYHDNNLAHHATPEVTAATIANIALLAWLRYPARYWPLAVLQIANRMVWCLRNGRQRGVGRGIAAIPRTIWHFRSSRKPVSVYAMRARRAQRRNGRLDVLVLDPFAPAQPGRR